MANQLSDADRAAIEIAVHELSLSDKNISGNILDISICDDEIKVMTGWRGAGVMARGGRGQMLLATKTGDKCCRL